MGLGDELQRARGTGEGRERAGERGGGHEEGPTATSRFIPSTFSRSWLLSSSLVMSDVRSSVVSNRSLDEPEKVRSRVDSWAKGKEPSRSAPSFHLHRLQAHSFALGE